MPTIERIKPLIWSCRPAWLVEKLAKGLMLCLALLGMKSFRFYHWLHAIVAVSLSLTTQRIAGHGMGGFGGHGPHGSFARGSYHHYRDHRFFHRHRHFFFGFDYAAFGFPYWWYADYGYPYYGYPGYPYDENPEDYAYSESAPEYDEQFWQDLAKKVQSELAHRGYYHGPIDGVIDSDSRQAIRAFQKAEGLPVTGLIDPSVLKALKLPVPHIPSRSGQGQ